MNWQTFEAFLKEATIDCSDQWERVRHCPRTLFDPVAAEWSVTTMDEKIAILARFRNAGIEDYFIRAYLIHYRETHPKVLMHFGWAVMEYLEHGFVIRIPLIPFVTPHGFFDFHVAALARAFEDGRVSPRWPWLMHEARRLHSALGQWLNEVSD